MTNQLPSSASRSAPVRMRPWADARAGGLALALVALAGVAPAAAQSPTNSPPPPRPAVAQAPPLQRPPIAPPPPSAGRPATPAAAAQATGAPAVAAKPAAVGLPVDSVRPKPAAVVGVPPANAVAQCRDGAFILAPSDASACASHRGLAALMPQRTAPPAVSSAAVAPAALAAAVPANAAPPAGATMRCKDGTYLGGTPSPTACAGHNGLAAVLPAARTPPPAPARPAQAARPSSRPAPRP